MYVQKLLGQLGTWEQGKPPPTPAPAQPSPPNPLLSSPHTLARATALATNSWMDVHTFTESGGGRVETLLECGRGVDLDGGATLGAAH